MNWINAFELICYVITFFLLADIVKRKNWQELYLFFSGALAGFMLELLAVRLTWIYHYSEKYYFIIGTVPYQFPFFGGLMWGGVTVCALRLSKKFAADPFKRALLTGWLVVSMDLLLDVAAIRLDGGFWIWEGRPITLEINHHMLMSVIWVNFLGYLFETPAIAYFTLKYQEKQEKSARLQKADEKPVSDQKRRAQSVSSVSRNLLAALLIGLAGVAFVAVASSLALLLDGISDEWFSCLSFILIWILILVDLLSQLYHKREKISFRGKKDWVLFSFWAALYGYCLAALWKLEILQSRPLYALLSILLATGTLTLCLMKVDEEKG